MKFRGYVFEWPRVTQATPQSGLKKKSNIPRRKYSSNEANKHKIIIQDVNLSF